MQGLEAVREADLDGLPSRAVAFLMPPKAKPKGGGELNDRQRLFVREYLVDLNATQAAIRAGYSARSAAEQAYDLLRNPKIAAEIQAAGLKREQRTEITADRVLTELLRLAMVDVGAAFDANGHLLPLREMPEDVRRAISGLEAENIPGREGVIRKVKFWDKKGALELLGRHLVLFTDKTEHSGGLTLEVAVTVADASS